MAATANKNLDEVIGESSDSRTIPLPTASNPSKRDLSPSFYNKLCDLCHNSKDVLVRCRIDETHKWYFVCTGKCWRQVSGGEIDGPDMPFYQYGGVWSQFSRWKSINW